MAATATLPPPLAPQKEAPILRAVPLGDEPVLGAFLGLFDKDIDSGQNLYAPTESMISDLKEFLNEPVDLNEPIEGPVDLG